MTGATTPLRVALADDSAESRALLRAMLEVVDGVDVVGVAADGAQAVELVAQESPDLILLDIAMPVMDGLEAATAIRARTPGTKIAMYSGYNRARMAPAALAAGADQYVEKAASIDELLEQIQRLFPDRPTLRIKAAHPTRPPVAGPSAVSRTSLEQRYRMLLDALEEGVLVTDGEGLVSDANFVATRVLDAPLRRLLGRSLQEVGLNGGTEGAHAMARALRKQRPVSGIDYTLVRPDGERRDLMVSVRPLHDLASLSVHENLVSFVDLTELKRAEEQLHAAISSMHDAFFLFRSRRDASGAITDLEYVRVNDEACRITGRPAEELIGHGLVELFPSHRDTGLFDRYRAVVETGEPYHDVVAYDLDGIEGTFDFTVTKAGDGCLFVSADITDRLRAEHDLRASEQLFRGGFENSSMGMALTDLDGTIKRVNGAYARMMGYPDPEDLVGVSFAAITYPDDVARDREGIRGMIAGKPYRTQKRYVRADGSTLHGRLVSAAVTDEAGAPVSFFTQVEDITEQLRAEHAVAASEQRLHAIFEAISEGVIVYSPERDTNGRVVDFRIEVINDAACRQAHFAREEVLGRLLTDVRPQHRTSGVLDGYIQAMERGRPFAVKGISLMFEWEPGRVETRAFDINTVTADELLVATWRDVTDEIRARDALERSNHDLEAFASALSHDLREPLRTTAGFVQLITDHYADDLPEPARDLFGYVVSGTERMNDRITAILGFARAGAAAAPPHPVDSAAAAAAAAADCEVLITDAGAELDISPLPVVRADALQLQRVFQNLITNASKYTRPGTTPHITLSAEQLGDHWHFTVADNGPGIPETQRERIFAMFVRGDVEQGHDGHGMGLALCRRIIESYDGRIWVEPNPDGGSLFRFTLPVANLP